MTEQAADFNRSQFPSTAAGFLYPAQHHDEIKEAGIPGWLPLLAWLFLSRMEFSARGVIPLLHVTLQCNVRLHVIPPRYCKSSTVQFLSGWFYSRVIIFAGAKFITILWQLDSPTSWWIRKWSKLASILHITLQHVLTSVSWTMVNGAGVVEKWNTRYLSESTTQQKREREELLSASRVLSGRTTISTSILPHTHTLISWRMHAL